MTTAKVEILLATYNCAPYIDTLLESLVAQDYSCWSIIARDDGSSDDTRASLAAWKHRLGTRFRVLPDSGLVNMGIARNFSKLLAASTAPYVMFAGHDDLWHPDKVSRTLSAVQHRESQAGKHRPCLAHTDLRMVNERLEVVAPSFWRYQGLCPKRAHGFPGMLVENLVWGCTAMLNRPLVELSAPIPEESHEEDWWIAIVAAAFGEIVSVPLQTIDWRRHSANDSAVSRLSSTTIRTLYRPRAMRAKLIDLFAHGRPRARIFMERYQQLLRPDQLSALEAFLNLLDLGPIARRRAVLRHKLLFSSWVRNVGLLLMM